MQDSTVAGFGTTILGCWSIYYIFEHHVICQNKQQTSVLLAQIQSMYRLHCPEPFILFASQIINTHGHERPDYSEAIKHLGGPSTIFPNSTVCCSNTPKLYTVISIYPFKEKPMLFGLPRLQCSLAKESFFQKFCTIG